MYKEKKPCIHFVGIGGSGMNGLAQILLTQGCQIRGSDINISDVTKKLEDQGAIVFKGHQAENISKETNAIVVSSAIQSSNPEIERAIELSIPVIHRAEMLAEIMRLKFSVAVSGTHGKTTTTSLLGSLLIQGGYDPSVFVGGRLNETGTFGKHGNGKWIIAESDESDGSFMNLLPTLAIVTNIDNDHMSYYKDLTTLKSTFLDFINRLPFYGKAVVCGDDANIMEISEHINRPLMHYGLKEHNELRAVNICVEDGCTSFYANFQKKDLGKFQIPLYGNHNVLNSLACIGICLEMEINLEHVRTGLQNFTGVDRRFTFKGKLNGAEVFDDYGHHPTEIKSVLQAARSYRNDAKIVVCFQPHRFSRTRDVLNQFGSCFSMADEILLFPIYAAGEEPISGVDSKAIASVVKRESGQNIQFVKDFSSCKKLLKKIIQPDNLVLCMGAGSITSFATDLVD